MTDVIEKAARAINPDEWHLHTEKAERALKVILQDMMAYARDESRQMSGGLFEEWIEFYAADKGIELEDGDG